MQSVLFISFLSLFVYFIQIAFRLLLLAAVATEKANITAGGYAAICEEFASQALVCFQEEITDSKKQFAALTEVGASVCLFVCFFNCLFVYLVVCFVCLFLLFVCFVCLFVLFVCLRVCF